MLDYVSHIVRIVPCPGVRTRRRWLATEEKSLGDEGASKAPPRRPVSEAISRRSTQDSITCAETLSQGATPTSWELLLRSPMAADAFRALATRSTSPSVKVGSMGKVVAWVARKREPGKSFTSSGSLMAVGRDSLAN